MRHRQLAVFLENKPSVLAEVCRALAEANINIQAISITDTVDYCVVRLVVDDAVKALHLLGDGGALVVEADILSVELPHRPAALAGVAEKLAAEGINVEYAYGSGDGAKARVFLRVSDVDRAERILGSTA